MAMMETMMAREARTTGQAGLSADEVRRFHEQGFLRRFELVSSEEMESIRRRMYDEVLHRPSSYAGEWAAGMDRFTQSRHLDSRVVWDLCSRPAVVQKMVSLLGRDLL